MPTSHNFPRTAVTGGSQKEGFIFGLTGYWVEDGKLRYVTTYGWENAIDLDRIGLAWTVKLNSDRGVAFILSERPRRLLLRNSALRVRSPIVAQIARRLKMLSGTSFRTAIT
jgi:hypothetical protein